MVKSGFFGGYSCEWCNAKFDSKEKAWDHELDCEMSPSNLQKEARKLTGNSWEKMETLDENYYAKKALEMEQKSDYKLAIELYGNAALPDEVIRVTRLMADDKVKHLDYDKAIVLYESLGDKDTAKSIRKLKAEQGSVKVDQTVVHGDQVTKTEIRDSVLNRSNVGGGSSKMQELKDLTEMKEKGLIDDDEFKQMKKEILGK
jgi:hypothetical protein